MENMTYVQASKYLYDRDIDSATRARKLSEAKRKVYAWVDDCMIVHNGTSFAVYTLDTTVTV
jgi:hypothetical protein